MNTFLWIVAISMVYLAIAGWVYFDTTPPIYDDSQLRRTLKLMVLFPVIAILFVVFIVTVIVVEYWEYLRSKRCSTRETAHGPARP